MFCMDTKNHLTDTVTTRVIIKKEQLEFFLRCARSAGMPLKNFLENYIAESIKTEHPTAH